MNDQLPKPLHRTIFKNLVATQDAGASVPDSHFGVAKKHNVEGVEVRRVERGESRPRVERCVK